MPKELLELIPENVTGKPLDIEKTIEAKTVEQAEEIYQEAYRKLRHPFEWENFSGSLGTKFILVKGGGNQNLRQLELGDFIKIDLPGPGPKSGDGFDWVCVEWLEENPVEDSEESLGIRVRACSNPTHLTGDIAAHVFKDTATSTFIIERSALIVSAIYAGRNEVPNLKDANLHDKLRNAAVSFAALAGVSEHQWNGFVESLINIDTNKSE